MKSLKKTFAFVLSLAMILAFMSIGMITAYANGEIAWIDDTGYSTIAEAVEASNNGAKDIILKDEEGMTAFATYVNIGNNCSGLTFKLGDNIELTGSWIPIGTETSFNGTFDGDAHTISGLSSEGAEDIGLFGHVVGATIKNVTITGANLSASSGRVGALVGHGDCFTASDCHVTGNINILGSSNTGGLIGVASNAQWHLSNCSVEGSNGSKITGTNMVGGLIGNTDYEGSVTGCTVKNVIVRSPKKLGGLIGQVIYEHDKNNNDKTNTLTIAGTVENTIVECNASTKYEDFVQVGGVVGMFYNSGTKISNVSVDATVKDVTVNGIESSMPDDLGGVVTAANVGLVSGGFRQKTVTESKTLLSNDVTFDIAFEGTNTVTGNTNYTNYIGIYNPAPATNVAKIGNVEYTSLAAAVEAAGDDDTITMIADSAESTALTISKNLTIDVNGKTVSFEPTPNNSYWGPTKTWFNVTANHTLSVIDTASTKGAVKVDPGYTCTVYFMNNRGTVNLGTTSSNGPVISLDVSTYNQNVDTTTYANSCPTNRASVYGITNYSTINVKYATIQLGSGGSSSLSGVTTQKNATATYEHASFTITGGSTGITCYNGSNNTIENSTFTIAEEGTGIATNGAKATITDCVVNMSGHESMSASSAYGIYVNKSATASTEPDVIITNLTAAANYNSYGATVLKVNAGHVVVNSAVINAGNNGQSVYFGASALSGFENSPQMEIKGGKYYGEFNAPSQKGRLVLSGGKYSQNPTVEQYGSNVETRKCVVIPEGYELADNTGDDASDFPYIVRKAITYVAEIGDNNFETLQAAFDAAKTGDTIKLLTNVEINDRVYVNAGDKTLDEAKRFATTSDTRSVTLDLDGHDISGSNNIALAGGSLAVTGKGKIYTSADGLAPIEIRGTGTPANKRTLTIGSDVILEGSSYGLNIFGTNDETKNTIDVTINGTVNGTVFVLGNLRNTSNAININVGNTAILNDIAQNGYSSVTIADGATLTSTSDGCVEIRAGSLTINGGTFTNSATEFSCTANGSGTTTKGAAIAVAQHTTNKPITVTIKDGTFTGPCALSIANPQSNATNNVDVSVEGGFFKGTETTVAQTVKNADNRVKGFITSGVFYDDRVVTGTPSILTADYVADGYEAVVLVDGEGGNVTERTKDYAGWYQVGKVSAPSVDKETTTTTGYDATYTATKTVVSDEEATLESDTSITVNVKAVSTTDGRIEADTDIGQISSDGLESIVKSAVGVSNDAETGATINVEIKLVSDDPQVETVDGVKTITYDIHPEAFVSVGNVEVGSVKLANNQLASGTSFTIKMKVPDAVYDDIKTNPRTVTVIHTKNDGTVETFASKEVTEAAGAYYVTITGVSSFSDFMLTPDLVGQTPSVKCTANLALEDSIDVWLYVHTLKNVTADQLEVRYTVQGVDHVKALDSVSPGSDGSYGFVIAECAAAEVADDFTFAVYKKDGTKVWPKSSEAYTYSPKIYCEKMLDNGGISAKEQALDKALLDYGTYAQTRFDHNTNNPANSKYSYGGVSGVTIPDDYPFESSGSLAGKIRVTANLELESKTELNFTLNPVGGIDATAATVKINETPVNSAGTYGDGLYVRTDNDDGTVTIKVNGIAAAKLGTAPVVVIEHGGSTRTIKYSPMTYAYNMQGDDTESDVVKALYNYYITAKAYFDEKSAANN